jgi:photosystem II stability/assembly factor-like uncharacterized protein
MAFADSLIGYITDLAHGDFRTTNGGLSWTEVGAVGSNDQMVVFGNAHVGWKFGGGGTYRTTDAGATWTFVSAPYYNSGTYSKSFALDQNRVWLAMSATSDRPNDGAIWYSSDSGLHWTRLAQTFKSDTMNQVNYSDLRFKPSGIGIVVGTIRDNYGLIGSFASRTTDFGNTWTTTKFSNESPRTVLSITDDIWIILGVGTSSFMRRSIDSGRTWTYTQNMFEDNPNYYFGAATYVPDLDRVVVSTLAGIYSSADSGLTFTRNNYPLDIAPLDVALDSRPNDPAQQLVFAPCLDGKFLISTDAGNNWIQGKNSKAGGYTNTQSLAVQNVVYFVSGGTKLFRSTDFGSSWTETLVSPNGPLRAVSAYDKGHVACQGYENMHYTSDGGETWTRAPLPGNYTLNQSAMPSPGTIIGGGSFYDSTGSHGFFYQTSDGGFNWSIVDVPKEIKILKMITAREGFACGDYEFYRTKDAGKTWNLNVSSQDFFTHYEDFFFDDSLHGLLRVSFDFQETYDGGTTWHPKPLGLPIYTIDRFVRTAQGTMLAVGEGMLWSQLQNSTSKNLSQSKTIATRTGLKLDVFPNPFNPSTTIQFSIPMRSRVRLAIFNLLGQQVAELANEEMEPGNFERLWNANVSSGLYFCWLEAVSVSDPGKRFVDVKKMVLLK